MPRLCTGCGLTTDDDGNLIAAVSGTADFTACAAANFGKTYCNPNDGKLYVDPPSMYRKWKFVNEINPKAPAESVQLTDYGVTQAAVSEVGDNVVKTFTGTASTITNPSKCLPMALYVEIGIQHALFTVNAGGPTANDFATGDIQIESYYTLSGGINAIEQPGGHQHWGAEADGGQGFQEIYRMDSSGAFLDLPSNANGTSPFILPPGGSVTLTPIGKLIVIRYVTTGRGKVQLENWRTTIEVTGWAGA